MARRITLEQIHVEIEGLVSMTAEQRHEVLLAVRDFRDGVCERLQDPELIPEHLRDKIKVRVTK